MKKFILLLIINCIAISSLFSNVKTLNLEKDQILEALNKTIQYEIYWIPVLNVADTVDVFEINEVQGFEEIGENEYKIIIADSLLVKFIELFGEADFRQSCFTLMILEDSSIEDEDSSNKHYFPWLFYYGNTPLGYNPDFEFPKTVAIVESDVVLAIYAALNALKEKYDYSFNGHYLTDKKEKLERLYIGDIVVQEQGNQYRIYQRNFSGRIGETFRRIRFECVVEKGTYDIIKVQ